MKKYYECHITMKADALVAKKVVETNKWKFSAIDGDPVLGAGVLCYATNHFNCRKKLDNIVLEMNIIASVIGRHNIKVIRQKVELVVYDTKVAA